MTARYSIYLQYNHHQIFSAKVSDTETIWRTSENTFHR